MTLLRTDFIPMYEAAKVLDIPIDKVMFLIDEGRLKAFFPEMRRLGNPDFSIWQEIVPPIVWRRTEINFRGIIIFDANLNYHSENIRPLRTQSFTVAIDSVRVNQQEVKRLQQKLAHRKYQKEDVLDKVIQRAAKDLISKGKDWKYMDLLRQINHLREHDDYIGGLIEAIDIKKAIIHWREGVWVKESASKRTIQNRMTALYPKKHR